jgi:ABC-type transport system involved in multi-copper enzyme maturation permease subunit
VIGVLAAFALREALRRRVFTVVAVLTALFLALYGLGVWQAFRIAGGFGDNVAAIDPRVVTGATMFGLSMFGTLFLGAVLAVFLTLGAVRGDAERGLLQPLVVRPVTRGELLAARLLAAGAVSGGYVIAVFLGAMLLTGAIGGWWPDRPVTAALGLALGVVVVAALALAGSVFLAQIANGIAIFMAFGAGLTAGLLREVGHFLNSHTLTLVGDLASWALPFEALYQAALAALTTDSVGFTRFALQLGPLGGAARGGALLWLFALAYVALVVAAARAAFARRDLS